MSQFKRVTGLSRGAVVAASGDVRFSLTRINGDAFDLVANVSAVEQIIAGLARMSAQGAAALKGQPQAAAAETVALVETQRDLVGTATILTLVSDRGVPYRFALSAQQAADIAARLKTESERPRPTGRA